MAWTIARVSIQGQIAGGEVWSINPCYTFGDFSHDTPTSTQLQAAVTAVNGVVPGAGMLNQSSTIVNIIGCRIELRQPGGTLDSVAEGLRSSTVAGTGTVSMPPQCAAVISLRTGTPGARGRGRLYWPTLAASLGSTNGRWVNASRDSFLAAAKTYLSAVGTAMQTPLSVSGSTLTVWSRANAGASPVNVLQMGDVIDTQRRRRDNLPESYAATSYP